MPWSPGDASKHKKGLSPATARKWAEVANSTLQRTGDEGAAIRAANGVTRGSIKRRLEERKQSGR